MLNVVDEIVTPASVFVRAGSARGRQGLPPPFRSAFRGHRCLPELVSGAAATRPSAPLLTQRKRPRQRRCCLRRLSEVDVVTPRWLLGLTWLTCNRRGLSCRWCDALTTYDRHDISRLGPGTNVNGAMRGKGRQAASVMSAERRGGSRKVAWRLRTSCASFEPTAAVVFARAAGDIRGGFADAASGHRAGRRR